MTRRIDARGGACGAKRAARTDRRDAIAAQRDIAVVPRSASAVNHAAVLDHDVEGCGGIVGTAAHTGAGRAGGNADEKSEAEQYGRATHNGVHRELAMEGQMKRGFETCPARAENG